MPRDHCAAPTLSGWGKAALPPHRELSYWPIPSHRLLLLAAEHAELIGRGSGRRQRPMWELRAPIGGRIRPTTAEIGPSPAAGRPV